MRMSKVFPNGLPMLSILDGRECLAVTHAVRHHDTLVEALESILAVNPTPSLHAYGLCVIRQTAAAALEAINNDK